MLAPWITSGALRLGAGPTSFIDSTEVPQASSSSHAMNDISGIYNGNSRIEPFIEGISLVEGRPTDESGTVVCDLIEDRNLRVHAVARGTQGARDAITHWTFISERTGASLIDITIETGRRHQIRKAMSSIGTPVIGDRDHGGHRSDLHRLGLHAWSIEFDHPETGEPIEGVAPIPNPFRPWADASKIPFANL